MFSHEHLLSIETTVADERYEVILRQSIYDPR